MATKTTEQSFVQNWMKLRGWAQRNHIPTTAIIPVYQMDLQRLQHGKPMSEADRYRSVLAAAHMNNPPTKLPQDIAKPGDIISNVHRTLANIMTGLEPSSLIHNFYDMIKNTFEHPETLIKPIYTSNARKAEISHPTRSLLSIVPGAQDALDVMSHGGNLGAAISTLASHPLMSALDVMPAGKILDAGLRGAGLDVGEIAARRLGEPRSPSDTFFRNVGKLAKSIPHRDHYHIQAIRSPEERSMLEATGRVKEISDATDYGQSAYMANTIGDTMKQWMQRHHVGGEIGNLMYGTLSLGEEKTKFAEELTSPLNDAMSKLDDNQRARFWRLLTQSGKSTQEIVETLNIAQPIRDAVAAYEPVADWLAQRGLDTDQLIHIRTPNGRVELYKRGGKEHKAIETARAKLIKATADFTTRKQEAMHQHILAGIQDKNITRSLDALLKVKDGMWTYINNTLPQSGEKVADLLRRTSTAQHRWERTPVFNKDRIYRLKHTEDSRFDTPALRRAIGGTNEPVYVRQTEELAKSHANIISDVFKPGGLIDQMAAAYKQKDFPLFRAKARTAERRMSGKFAMEINIKSQPQLFDMVRAHLRALSKLSQERVKSDREFIKIASGITKSQKKRSAVALAKAHQRAQNEFTDAGIRNPPPAAVPLWLTIFTHKLYEHERAPEAIRALQQEFMRRGAPEHEVEHLGSNPRLLMGLLTTFVSDAYDNPIIGSIMPEMIKSVKYSAFQEVDKLLREGFQLHYIHNVNPNQISESGFGTYNVYLTPERIAKPSQLFERTFNFGTSVYNMMASVSHAVKGQLQHDGAVEFHQQYLNKFIHQFGSIQQLSMAVPEFRDQLLNVDVNKMEPGAAMTNVIKQLNLVKYEPESIFGFKPPGPATSGEGLYIDKDIADAVGKIMSKGQFPMDAWYDKVTNLFRMSILGLSPRFTAHILFGGTFLLALRTNPLIFRYIPQAYRMVRDKTMPGSVLHSLTQEGNEQIAYHYLGGRTGARWTIEQYLAKFHIPPQTATLIQWMQAGANINYRFTRVVGNMQRALAFFDGVAKHEKLHFYTDEEGRQGLEISDERALYEGMKSVERVMGDVRRMVPFERQMLTRVMPFYGWTKHILRYVLSYPIDHPFRAQILANMANASSIDIPSLLPTRLQLLLFLGKPDPMGNVTALTDRFFDPLRTVPNYATFSGYLSALNPVILAPFAYVNPEIIYGSNSLYPSVHYTQVYGIQEAGAQGGPLAAISQVVPETSALAAALKLSHTYKEMAREDPAALKKVLFESLNVPFLNVQHLNIKQIAAKNELARFKQATTAATRALYTDTFNIIKTYPTVPFPTNKVYNVTPQQLEEIYNRSISEYGLPSVDTSHYIRSPAGL